MHRIRTLESLMTLTSQQLVFGAHCKTDLTTPPAFKYEEEEGLQNLSTDIVVAGACCLLPIDEYASALAAVLDTPAARDGRLNSSFAQANHGWLCGLHMVLCRLQPPDEYGRLRAFVAACVQITIGSYFIYLLSFYLVAACCVVG